VSTSESRLKITGKFLEYGAGEGWRRSVGLIDRSFEEGRSVMLIESRRREIYYKE
jgi:hypothetical protein